MVERYTHQYLKINVNRDVASMSWAFTHLLTVRDKRSVQRAAESSSPLNEADRSADRSIQRPAVSSVYPGLIDTTYTNDTHTSFNLSASTHSPFLFACLFCRDVNLALFATTAISGYIFGYLVFAFIIIRISYFQLRGSGDYMTALPVKRLISGVVYWETKAKQ